MTTLYCDCSVEQYQSTETIVARDGKQVTFHSEIHGIIDGRNWRYVRHELNWRYSNYELQVQACNDYWLSEDEAWTPFH
ncbi:MAG: hypothetical protein WBA13_09730 [Microcoleaceae cyanobacterium]